MIVALRRNIWQPVPAGRAMISVAYIHMYDAAGKNVTGLRPSKAFPPAADDTAAYHFFRYFCVQ